ncbi:MAG: TylF/MycF/NovP-related O-methyltransferase [Azospirillaceae bacterium]|nr:TylF/MycF/NovP-related O-methyltransferase [Azospirillaceae bacterium]
MDAAALYIELLKKILMNEIYFEHEASMHFEGDETARREARRQGRDVPGFALTMVGRLRLDNLHACLERALGDQVPGDVMEAGTWRGGASILMRGILKAHGVTERTVWVADSFEGLPPPDIEKFPADADSVLHQQAELAVSLAQVQGNFARFDLLDDQVRFIKGFFSDTLPTAPVGPLAVLRLDGDMYESTFVSLNALYDKVSSGGFVIIDDYNCYASCRQAVADFARMRGLQFDIEVIDWTGAFWRKA